MENKAIKTKEVGFINGRDAIYLDEFKQTFNKTQNCVFKGVLNPKLVEKTCNKSHISYVCQFEQVIYYEVHNLDLYNENILCSSFDIVENSNLLVRLKKYSSKVTKEHKHYVFATYDYVYDIIATNYKLEID
ncbi:hypothetical protein EG240_07930 [Paenimyroides tangerinum]|uniref:Uncharacterized protein n=1 Tax=Paenimyroides tangerinum TaxID=2488728 RepID=A0A3P3W8E7_9FLAO|nr:hypothetical protein [Paenimyroides tangerinum]RRJ90617.1 hypothetical protein EG240_07930 [Paenimyroides tangerinum]